MLFAFAAYNAGPARVAGLRKQAVAQGLDPDRWFNHVERVAAREIGRETVQYVSNIYKYYVAYKMGEEQAAARARAKRGAPRAAPAPSPGGRGRRRSPRPAGAARSTRAACWVAGAAPQDALPRGLRPG
jgi:hypothetical protein